ncbi:potassium transporter TrkA [Sulfurifustis variabilis]|uniref:Potassium transporter TrkA n=1 Tax=Sulfurifustis variabilis TaxID=1675686 RepID=A0A1B4V5X5_9GAMM|nr:potassium channel protein [Sulfurifustis variabilis]BAU48940.1 potassium transporter TrkA [Sulfurifustis variabilis]
MARKNTLFIVLRRLRVPLLVLIVSYAIAVLGLVLMPGIDERGQPDRLSFFHALYVITYTVTTTGFGELPHPFTEAQRLWIMFSLYAGVIAWLYAIGALIAAFQEPAFRQLIRENRFAAVVRRRASPFYVVCGYGDTGSLVVEAMARHELDAVVVDIDPDRLTDLSFANLPRHVPYLNADAALPETLLMAGLQHPYCRGVVALTHADGVNLHIAITAKLLNPRIQVVCRADAHETKANMESFGTDAVVVPFDVFADRLATALHSPDMDSVYEWLTRPADEPLPPRLDPPRGTWVLCGFGRFGKAVDRFLKYQGVPTVIVEKEPERTQAPEDTVVGRGTEAVTLRAAHVERAVGIVAGTDDDANNLSIIVTARELNPRLFLVARQNSRKNDAVFEAAGLDLVMQRSRVIAARILVLLVTPLLNEFLRLARHQSNDWARQLIARLEPLAGGLTPDVWAVEITPSDAPAVHEAIAEGRVVHIGDLLRDPRARSERLPGLALMLQRVGEEQLLPEEGLVLQAGDRLLFAGASRARVRMQRALLDRGTLYYIGHGEVPPEGWIWRRLARRPP